MNGSIRHARFALGTVALLALAAGCSKESKPAQQPTPTFESRVTEPGEPGAQPGMQPGTDQGMQHGMPEGQQPAQPAMPSEPTAQPPAQPAEPQAAPPSAAPAMPTMSEREMCDDLTHDVTIRVEDIQGGVAMVFTPKSGGDISMLRDNARKVERSMTPEGNLTAAPGAQPTPPAAGDRCALFDMGRMGARAVVSEGPNSVRLLFTSADPAVTKALRHDARDYAKSKGGMTNGKKSGGTKKSPEGSQPPPSGGTTP